jgi:BirA family biotin operon repressor/biotin-[acetyl-CoA-carboxylase] ligase
MIGKKTYSYKEIGSTNDEAKRLVQLGVGEGAVIIAEGQTKGRGKPGTTWFSPKGKGIYLSIIIQPHKVQGKIEAATLLGTLASARAIRGLTSLDVKVKWPNDVVVGGKKVGGVLTEACKGGGGKTSLIVGIGLNVSLGGDELPEEIRGTASSISMELGKKVSRTALIKALLEEFEKLYLTLLQNDTASIFDEWKILSETIGSNIKVNANGSVYEGRATGLGARGELILKTFDGKIKKFKTGNIVS